MLLEAILDAHPEVSGVLQDQPQVAARAQERLSGTAIASRCSLVAGDFFGSVPEGGDLYILKGILHDWDEAHASQILATCHHAMRAGGRLLLIEQVLTQDGNTDPFPRFMDLHMLVIHGARKRTEEDYTTLLSVAGFCVIRVLPTATGLEMIEATTS